MALMYCYGSGFHVSKNRSKCDPNMSRPNGVPVPCVKSSYTEHETVVCNKYFKSGGVPEIITEKDNDDDIASQSNPIVTTASLRL